MAGLKLAHAPPHGVNLLKGKKKSSARRPFRFADPGVRLADELAQIGVADAEKPCRLGTGKLTRGLSRRRRKQPLAEFLQPDAQGVSIRQGMLRIGLGTAVSGVGRKLWECR